MVKKIGFIGLGVMGASMSSRLIDAGYELYIYNRTKNKGDALVEKGAHWCDTPRSVAEQAEIILTIVGYPKDVEEVYEPVGCPNCNGGFRGRIALQEVLFITDRLRELISDENLDKEDLKKAENELYGGKK